MAKKKGKTKRVSRSYYYKQTGNEGGGNTGLVIGLIVVAVVGIGGYYLYKQGKLPFLQPKQPLPDGTKTGDGGSGSGSTSTGGGSGSTSTSGATPFTSKAQGNAFRDWVNDNYSSYAREIDLDRSGAKDNSYIRTAFAKYGTEYLAQAPSQLGGEETPNRVADTIANVGSTIFQTITGTSNFTTTPFANKQQGDAFRVWVNDTYPSYAQSIDLDRSGSFNNSFITKAYRKYGEEYAQGGNVEGSTPLGISLDADALFEAIDGYSPKGYEVLMQYANKPTAKSIREYFDNNIAKYDNTDLRGWIDFETKNYVGRRRKTEDGTPMDEFLIAKFY